jgi:hypothetical protein
MIQRSPPGCGCDYEAVRATSIMKLQFTTRALLVVTLLAAIACAFVTATNRLFQPTRPGPLDDPDTWVSALKDLVGDDTELRSDVTVYRIGGFMGDDRSIWLIKGESPLMDRLVSTNELEATTDTHPMAGQLLSSIPDGWPRPNLSACSWQATPGFGQRYMSGPDLFLIAHDETANVWYVLHHWNF